MPTEEEYVDNARKQWRERQEFLKSGVVIHEVQSMSETLCGLDIYVWEEDPWEYTPIADESSEVTCKNCLRIKKSKSK